MKSCEVSRGWSSGSTRALVLGGGTQGSAAALGLARRSEVTEVVVADRSRGAVPSFLEPFLGDKLRTVALDASDEAAVRRAMAGADVVLCALPYYLNLPMSRLAAETGVHFCDLGGNTETVERQRELDGEARERGISIVPDCGLAPGTVNVLAQAGIDAVGEPDSVRMWVGGLPRTPRPPLNYQVVYSLEGVLDYYTTPALILRDGRLTEVAALSGLETLEFPDPLGSLEAFYTAGGASTMPRRYEGRIRTLEYKTLRYPGHAQIMAAIRDLGLLDPEPVEVDGVRVSPRRLFIEQASPRLQDPGGADMVALRVEVRAAPGDGNAPGVSFELVDSPDPEEGLSAMMRCTGFSLAAVALLQLGGQVRPGVGTPDEAVPARPYLDHLEQAGLRVRRRTLP